jgi:type I restriction-modification system DNA methylase subunit
MIYGLKEDEIHKWLEKYMDIRIKEKNKYGEVFTPQLLIEKMLEQLPKNIFENPELKWLEPSSGTGNFMAIVYLRLMNGLKKWEPFEKKRSEHIIKNMLYFIELNQRNIDISKTLFGKESNILHEDFL